MYYVKKAIYGPDPAEQKRKVKAQIRRNQRELDKQLTGLQTTEQKTKTMIKAAAKRNDMKSARLLAREVFRAKKQKERLHRSKAQLNSVSLQVDEAFALRKIEGTMKSSTLIMKEVSNLVKLPELMGTMNALSQELMKAGIIEEMVSDTLDTLDETEMFEDEEAEGEVDAILSEITGNKLSTAGQVPSNMLPPTQEKAAPVAAAPEEEEDEDEELLNSMRERLKALQS
ncbi:hypothetical protein D0Z00_003511 [Geotrichum galactomycetum]|uniref:Uncharacterized protein n=1 Tax=Geotrichum galactomycetum TaxID=27317 RepID=A0ACB6V1C9_9ASCO|nr:hypothetical protein D0Z00_003511 [Geotrichum candidum]